MKTNSPFDASFKRSQNADGAWTYEDRSVHSACMRWLLFEGFDLVAFDDYLQEDVWNRPTAKENLATLIERRAQALKASKDGNHELATAWINFLYVTMYANKRVNFLLPLSRTGKKFVSGRKAGSIGPVRAAVRRYLKRQPQARAAQIWAALSAKPPKGMTFYDNRMGKYIETNGQDDETKYPRFRNIVSEERRLLKSKQD